MADVPADARLVTQPGCVVDPLAVQRLVRGLRSAAPDVAGVATTLSALPSGSSYRTVAARAATRPTTPLEPAHGPVRGAVLVRAGVPASVDAEGIHVAGALVVDPHAPAHDPHAPVGSDLRPALPEGRSPFPRAPLVLFLGLERDPGRGVWSRAMVEALLAEDVESRLAVAPVPPGPHLTGPCAPSEDTVRALEPDVVVALDDLALVQAPRWCTHRKTVLVHHTGERTLGSELVPWRIGHDQGRLRARIGSAIDAPSLAALCRRLSCGPLPAPPDAEPTDRSAVDVAGPTRRPSHRGRRVAWVRPGGAGAADPRTASILDEVRALGERPELLDAGSALTAVDHEAAIVSADLDPATAHELIDARARAGRRTVVDLGSDGSALALARRAGFAIVGTEVLADTIAGEGFAVRHLPWLLRRDRVAALRGWRITPDEDAPPVLGLWVDRSPEPAPRDAVATAVLDVVDDIGATLEIPSADEALVERLAEHPSVKVITEPTVERSARWTASVWLGDPRECTETGRPRRLVEWGYLGVPVVFPLECRGDVRDELLCRYGVADGADRSDWRGTIRAASTSGSAHRSQLATRTDVRFGPRASTALVNRVLGWAGRWERSR